MKRTYHTDLLIKYKLGVLDTNTIKNIPNSTLYNWRQKGFSHIAGLPDINDDEIDMMREFLSRKKLLKAAKALYFVFTTVQSAINKEMITESCSLKQKNLLLIPLTEQKIF